jgi:peptide/nickel transport system permease protein
VAFIAIPSFVVALYALLLFSVRWRWFPAIGAGESGDIADQVHHLALPAMALGLGWVGYIARLVRSSMLEVMEENHVRTARAFGLPEHVVIGHYALRIAILPTVTILGLGIGTMLSGALFAEIVFSRPGIGKLLHEAVMTRNYPVVMGSVLVTTVFFVISTLVSDILNAILDPRLRDAGGQR